MYLGRQHEPVYPKTFKSSIHVIKQIKKLTLWYGGVIQNIQDRQN